MDTCKLGISKVPSQLSFLDRDHPFKTSACLRGGEGESPLPMVADARGAGVLGLPTSGP